MTVPLTLTVNGDRYAEPVDPGRTLLGVLRDDLGLTGAKEGCDDGACGACTVLLDGAPIAACILPAHRAAGADVLTVEGLREGDGDALHPLQAALVDAGAVQCGFCTPGIVMTALGTLTHGPAPDAARVRAALAGNLCRCTGYQKVVAGVLAWAADERSPTPDRKDPSGPAT